MQTFIQTLAAKIVTEHAGNDMSNILVVFPSRRACLFFKKELTTLIQQPVWAPSVLPFSEVMKKMTDKKIPDSLTLIFELYKVYSKYIPGEPFEHFYSWGQMMLSDFDEIDRYMVSARRLFTNIADLKNIDASMVPGEDELAAIRKFREDILGKEDDPGRLRGEFMKLWNSLGNIYADFTAELVSRDMAYEGLAQRMAAETNDISGFASYDRIIFAGFYSFTRTEETILKKFLAEGKTTLVNDSDHYYLNAKGQEAGSYFGKNVFDKKHVVSEPLRELAEGTKNITVTGVALKSAQATVMAGDLRNLAVKEDFSLSDCAIVLPDENMLFPTLYSLPEEADNINITMGYPAGQTPAYRLAESIIRMYRNARTNASGTMQFYHQDVLEIIRHPYVMVTDPKGIEKWMTLYKEKKWIRIACEDLNQDEAPDIFKCIFKTLPDLTLFPDHLLQSLHALLSVTQHAIDKEFLYFICKRIQRLQDVLKNHVKNTGITIFLGLYREALQNERIPFEGEPLKGLQIMGFLETRALDFSNVFILSMNEGTLPANTRYPSYIPYSLRKGWRLPVYEDHDAVQAYHFYRLLQRADNIFFYYNTEVRAVSGGEKSRYLLQVIHELAAANPNIRLTQRMVSVPLHDQEIRPVVIEKNDAIMNRLRERKFSASALNMYINCKLQYYFKYVAGIKPPDTVKDEIAANEFGNILHYAMEFLYEPDTEITEERIGMLKGSAKDAVLRAFLKQFPGRDPDEGQHVIIRSIIGQLVEKILDTDKNDVPFRVIGAEEKMENILRLGQDGTEIMIQGNIDRVDQINGHYRVLDYKTGKVDLKHGDVEELFTNPDKKAIFQTYLYAWHYLKKHPGKMTRIGIYPLKALSGGIDYLADGKLFDEAGIGEFEARLKRLFAELLDADVPFTPAEDEKRCVYCDYREFCGR
jgi:CRISPR/Cas system-associated exonuclease Cas4 (RecB family)